MVVGLGIALVLVVLVVAFAFWARGAQATPEELARIDASLDAFLDRHRVAIEATRRPVVRFTLEPMAQDDLLASKVGGTPWWPAGEARPVDAQGNPLALLAQVNLADVPDSWVDLPREGLLQFLVATDWKFGQDYSRDETPAALAALRGHRVVYRSDASGPTQAFPAAAKKQLPLEVPGPLRMRFADAASETMSPHDARFESIFPGGLFPALAAHGEPDGMDEDTLSDALWDRYESEAHKLGGYPYFTQDDPRARTDLELLFQLVSSDGLMWGDAGVGNFFITDADLAARDFSRVYYSWDCC